MRNTSSARSALLDTNRRCADNVDAAYEQQLEKAFAGVLGIRHALWQRGNVPGEQHGDLDAAEHGVNDGQRAGERYGDEGARAAFFLCRKVAALGLRGERAVEDQGGDQRIENSADHRTNGFGNAPDAE